MIKSDSLVLEVMQINSDLLAARTELIELEYELDRMKPVYVKLGNYVKKHKIDICAACLGIAGTIGFVAFIDKRHKVGNIRKVYLDDGTVIGYF